MSGRAMSNASESLRVVHVMRAPLGGLFRHVCDLAQGQHQAGLKVGIVMGEAPRDPVSVARLRDMAGACELGIHVMPMSRMPGLGDVTNLLRLYEHTRRLGAEIIHGHGAKGGAYVRVLPRLAGGFRFYTPHGGSLHFDAKSLKGRLFFAAERLMRGRTDGFIFESEFGLRTFFEKVGDPIAPAIVIHNGVTEADSVPVSPGEDAADFVFIGELRALKGVGTLIEAMGLLKDAAHLRIVGSGAERECFEAMARKAPHNVRIDFMGPLPAREGFALGRVVVLPSHHESMPYVALEAAAAGVPLIGTHVGGVPEIFGPDASRLVAPGDPVALASALAHATGNPDDMRLLAARLRQRVTTDFSAARMAEGVTEFYRTRLDPVTRCNPGKAANASGVRFREGVSS